MSFLHWLDRIDKELFTFIHTQWTAPWLDAVMLFLRNPLVWIPLYAFMFFWAIKYGKKHWYKFVLLTIVTVSLTDFTSAHLLKPLFERLRPCYDPQLAGIIRGIIGCGGRYGMPSSHAANHFGLATFWFWSIFQLTGRKWYWLWLWAFLICLAQVYVGKHYPFDILAGALLGYGIGAGTARLFEAWAYPGGAKAGRLVSTP